MQSSQGVRISEEALSKIESLALRNNKSKSATACDLIRYGQVPPPKGKKVAVSFGMDGAVLARLQEMAAISGRTQAEVIEWLAAQAN